MPVSIFSGDSTVEAVANSPNADREITATNPECVVEGSVTGDELGVATWYVDGLYQTSTAMSGQQDTASYAPSIEAGAHVVTAYVWTPLWDHFDRVSWTIAVPSAGTVVAVAESPSPDAIVTDPTTLTVEGHLPGGNLGVATWYVDGSYRATTSLSGEQDTATYGPSIGEGVHSVTAHVWDESWDRHDEVQWTISDPVEPGTAMGEHRSLYVWDSAAELVSRQDVRERFFQRLAAASVRRLYLSWGAVRAESRGSIASFLADAHDQNSTVYGLVSAAGVDSVPGVERVVEAVLAFNDSQQEDARFDGLHLDVEPAHEDPDPDLDAFLSAYREVLVDADSTWSANGSPFGERDLPLVLSIGPWWAAQAPEHTRGVVTSDSVDAITIMAYADDPLQISQRVETVTDLDDSIPYEVAIETLPLDADGVTFYEEGWSAATLALEAVGRPRASDARFRGEAIHAYRPALSRWDCIRTVEATPTAGGDGVVVTTTIALDEPGGFPATLAVSVENLGDPRTQTVSLDLNAWEAGTVSVTLPVSPAVLGDREIRVAVLEGAGDDSKTVVDAETVTLD